MISLFRKRLFVVIAAVVAGCGGLSAHEDRLISVDPKDGNLKELPEQYQPASFDAKKRVLRVKDQEMTFPAFLNELLPKHGEKTTLQLSASWYHERSTLPPYLLIRYSEKDSKQAYGVLVSLETLKLIEVTKETKIDASSTQRAPIDLKKWQKEIDASVKKVDKP